MTTIGKLEGISFAKFLWMSFTIRQFSRVEVSHNSTINKSVKHFSRIVLVSSSRSIREQIELWFILLLQPNMRIKKRKWLKQSWNDILNRGMEIYRSAKGIQHLYRSRQPDREECSIITTTRLHLNHRDLTTRAESICNRINSSYKSSDRNFIGLPPRRELGTFLSSKQQHIWFIESKWRTESQVCTCHTPRQVSTVLLLSVQDDKMGIEAALYSSYCNRARMQTV